MLKIMHSGITLFLAMLITACKSDPPTLMRAMKGFATPQETALHVAEMRTHHMHLLRHKRDETVYRGIRTATHSLNACIDCHIPAPTAQAVIRHTDAEHFCMTCHLEVAVTLDCFECHADRPALKTAEGIK